MRLGYSAIRCQSVSIWVHPWLNLTTAVNAKTPRGKGARDRKMTREKQVYITHPGGDSPHQPKPLRLCTFAPLRWFNCFFSLKLSQSWATTRVRLGEVAEPTRPQSDPVVGASNRAHGAGLLWHGVGGILAPPGRADSDWGEARDATYDAPAGAGRPPGGDFTTGRKLRQRLNGNKPRTMIRTWLPMKIINHLNAASMKP